jgi:hypothetical protein
MSDEVKATNCQDLSKLEEVNWRVKEQKQRRRLGTEKKTGACMAGAIIYSGKE